MVARLIRTSQKESESWRYLRLFILIWAGFIAATYFIGLAVEAMWGSGASLLTFLILFFGSIYGGLEGCREAQRAQGKSSIKVDDPK